MFEIAHAATAATAKGAAQINALDAILLAGPVVKLTLIILVIMSFVCWAIIYSKRNQFIAVAKADDKFEEAFWHAGSFEEVHEQIKSDNFKFSSMSQIFADGYAELKKIANSNLAKSSKEGPPHLSGSDNLERSLNKSLDQQLANLENRLTFLATTGSVGPFIGLFGTVWGIMGAFQKIGATGSANLAVVAPAISEALIATAVGLAAAIPASVAYNAYITKLKRKEVDLSNFARDFLNLAKRNFFQGN